MSSETSKSGGAACIWPDGKAYFFQGDHYISYNAAKLDVEPGFPRKIADGWPGVFEKDIDAAFAWPEGGALAGKAFFFRADEFVRFDLTAGTVDAGYPQKIIQGWPGVFPEAIDAICAWPSGTPYAGKIYFLSGDEYIRFDIEKWCADQNYPQKINGGNWVGVFDSAIDSACVWPAGTAHAGKIHFFRGKEYIKYDIATELAEEGFPRPIVGDWPGLDSFLGLV